MQCESNRWNAVCGESRMHGVEWGKIQRLMFVADATNANQRITYHYKPKPHCYRPVVFIWCLNAPKMIRTLQMS